MVSNTANDSLPENIKSLYKNKNSSPTFFATRSNQNNQIDNEVVCEVEQNKKEENQINKQGSPLLLFPPVPQHDIKNESNLKVEPKKKEEKTLVYN
jgi:hypothetical protein